ncbi:MAG: CocE/NonD family hydrolase [Armatimonadetes bacterium]|nr:CocE/NonD family hydrolase [Armatimonadota bacterium]
MAVGVMFLLSVPPLLLTFQGHLLLFLASFLLPPSFNPLEAISDRPAVRRIRFSSASGRPILADVYLPERSEGRLPGVLLYSPAAREGLDNPAQQRLAESLARLGYVTMLPFPRGREIEQVSVADIADARASLERFLQLPEMDPSRSIGICESYGALPLLLAASRLPPSKTPSRFMVLAGAADLREMLRFATTGAFEYGGYRGRYEPDPYVVTVLRRSLLSQAAPADRPLLEIWVQGKVTEPPPGLSEEGRRIGMLLLNRDPERFDALYGRLPHEHRKGMDMLRLPGRLESLSKPVHIIHPKDDLYVPPTEALRLRDALPREARGSFVLLPVMGHGLPEIPEMLKQSAAYMRSLYLIYQYLNRTLYPTS